MKNNEAERLIESITVINEVVSNLKGFKSTKLLSAAKKLELAALPLKEEVVHNMDEIVDRVIVRIKDNYPGLFYSANSIIDSTHCDNRLNKYLRALIVTVINLHNNQDSYLDIDLWIDFIASQVSQKLRTHNISSQFN